MNIFKRLFSSKKESSQPSNPPRPSASTSPSETSPSSAENTSSFDGIATEAYFEKRYKEEQVDPSMLDGALKMVESYFMDNKIDRQIKDPIQHPINLDQTIDDGMGFPIYCKAFDLEENHALMFLVFGFNDFMISQYGFKLYKDTQPEYPLRTMTLKYDNEGAKLSLYPIEYAAKVMRYEASFEDLHQRIAEALKNMPTANDVIDKMTGEKE